MARVEAAAQERVMALMRDSQNGINANLSAIENRDGVPPMARVDNAGFFNIQASSAMIDGDNDSPSYPHVLVYIPSDDDQNLEKFGYFSGGIRVTVEIRISDAGSKKWIYMEADLYRYVEAARTALQNADGNFGEGMTFNGEHSTSLSAAVQGGENVIQGARMTLGINGYVPKA